MSGHSGRSTSFDEGPVFTVRERTAHRLSRRLMVCCRSEQNHVLGSKPALQAGSNRLKDSDDGREPEAESSRSSVNDGS